MPSIYLRNKINMAPTNVNEWAVKMWNVSQNTIKCTASLTRKFDNKFYDCESLTMNVIKNIIWTDLGRESHKFRCPFKKEFQNRKTIFFFHITYYMWLSIKLHRYYFVKGQWHSNFRQIQIYFNDKNYEKWLLIV